LKGCAAPEYAGTARQRVDLETLRQFMQELARGVRGPGNIYLTGGATALLLGFREQTIDIDLKLDPEPEGAFEAIARLKDRLDVNLELASPDDFIPPAGDFLPTRARMNRSTHRAFLPGENLVEQGIADVAGNRQSDCALLVLIAAPRLKRLGIRVPDRAFPVQQPDPAHRQLRARPGTGADADPGALRLTARAGGLVRPRQGRRKPVEGWIGR